jgi:hypothetical protein
MGIHLFAGGGAGRRALRVDPLHPGISPHLPRTSRDEGSSCVH